MAEEIIKYGAGGVPYVGKHSTTEAPEPTTEEVAPTEEEVEPTVSVTVTEKETPGDIPTGKKGRK